MTGIEQAIYNAGGQSALARLIGCLQQNVGFWLRQGYCPARKCPHCHGMGYDASGQKCTCQPYEPNNTMAWILGVLIAVMLVLISIQERT